MKKESSAHTIISFTSISYLEEGLLKKIVYDRCFLLKWGIFSRPNSKTLSIK